MAGKSNKISKAAKTPEQKAIKLAGKLLPEGQAKPGEFALQDVQNQTEAQQRDMMRSDEKKTIRRRTRVEKLLDAQIIDRDEAAACEWYANAHAIGYETLGIVADYGRSGGGGGDCVVTHLAKYRAQQEARDDYAFARSAIPTILLPLFERVVLAGEALGGKGREHGLMRMRFRVAASVLRERILHLLPVR